MSGKIAVVTGAGSGIGRSAALALAKSGFAVVCVGRRPEELDKTIARCAPGDHLAAPADVSDETAVAALFKTVEQRYGRLDVLFNNAGVGAPPVPMDELPVAAWRQAVEVNLTGSFLCAREAFRIMRRQAPMGGRIINNGSISAYAPRPFSAPYTATKHGISGLTRSIALDGRAYDIACSQIDVGNAATEMTERMANGVLQANMTTGIEPRMNVDHVGDAVAFIASLPLDANVLFMNVMATKMPFVGRG